MHLSEVRKTVEVADIGIDSVSAVSCIVEPRETESLLEAKVECFIRSFGAGTGNETLVGVLTRHSATAKLVTVSMALLESN